jgi:hypothetical protein
MVAEWCTGVIDFVKLISSLGTIAQQEMINLHSAEQYRPMELPPPPPPPTIIPHPEGDHRCVTDTEITGHEWYAVRTSIANPCQISHYVDRDGPTFLRSTSGWNETHLHAFKVIFLPELPMSRILPVAAIPLDDDLSVLWVDQNLSASEKDIRDGNTGMGPGHAFYGQLAIVLKRIKSPRSEPIYPSSNLRSNTSIPIAMLPQLHHLCPTGLQLPLASPESIMSIISTNSRYQTLQSQGGRTSSNIRGSSDKDKVESATNSMAITLLNSITLLERYYHPPHMYRVEFRFYPLCPLTDVLVLNNLIGQFSLFRVQ